MEIDIRPIGQKYTLNHMGRPTNSCPVHPANRPQIELDPLNHDHQSTLAQLGNQKLSPGNDRFAFTVEGRAPPPLCDTN